MSILWAVPPVVLTSGLVLVALLLRKVDDERGELLVRLEALHEVRVATAAVRARTSDARAALADLQRR